MSDQRPFQKFKPEEEAHNTRLARLQYDPAIVGESIKRWADYSDFEKDLILEQGAQIHRAIADAIDAGLMADSAEVQQLIARWAEHLHYFYTPTLALLRGLGELYSTDPSFAANFRNIHVALPDYLTAAITHYVDDLEDAELRRLIAEDDQRADAL